MHKTILEYWQVLENLPDGHRDKPSPRVCVLLQEMFEKWRSKPAWIDQDQLGHLFDKIKGAEELEKLSIIERKGIAIQRTLELITREEIWFNAGSFEVHPAEIIVGTMPPYSVGQGKELMRYLTDDETLFWETRYLNEWSPFGHTVPDHGVILKEGTMGVISRCQRHIENTDIESKKSFYRSVISSLKGINHYANAYADACDLVKMSYGETDIEYRNMKIVAERLRKVPSHPAETFIEALQCIYLMHCALHFTGEIVPIGRLDQLLYPYYQKDIENQILNKEEAQEAIDAFWIKLDEKVLLNWRFAEDRFTSSDGALLGSGAASNFDQGALLNQWMQQITVGGVLANNDSVATNAENTVTEFCLNSARRLPLNSPTLDLRVHKKTSNHILLLAAEALLSGGAHPVLMNDDRIIPALYNKTGGNVELASARNYACDGCYETLFAGETEFSFGFVPALDVLEKALNGGAGFAAAGSTYLRGSKSSYRTKAASQITSYKEFYDILIQHIEIGCHKFYNGILQQYGIKESVSPSPLLSSMIGGCIESGRDISAGGARYKLFSPLMTGISTASDSLYVIKKLVFEQDFMTLDELVTCLRSDWGNRVEFIGKNLTKNRILEIREKCITQPKFGQGKKQVDRIAWELMDDFYKALVRTKKHSIHKEQWKILERRYSTNEHPFEILIAPGVGTFEQYVFGGTLAGATPDGRFAGEPIASDLSPSLLPKINVENPIENSFSSTRGKSQGITLEQALDSYADKRIDLMSDGAPADLNVNEDFPLEELVKVLRKFADGKGGNMLTITVSNSEMFKDAQKSPNNYDLLRVRMGGWTEFYIALFPNHQEQHLRRPLYSC